MAVGQAQPVRVEYRPRTRAVEPFTATRQKHGSLLSLGIVAFAGLILGTTIIAAVVAGLAIHSKKQ